MPLTMKEAAQDAIAVQDACNLSGVVQSFAKIVAEVIWPEAHKLGKGTEYVNTHPVVSMFLYKLADLNRLELENLENFSRIYAEVRKLAEETSAEVSSSV